MPTPPTDKPPEPAGEPRPYAEVRLSRSLQDELYDVLTQVIARRSAGENLPDSQVIAEHPHLMPALADEMRAMRDMRRAQVMAAAAGADQTPIEPLPASQLDDPITPDVPLTESELPTITGYHLLHEINTGGQATVYKAVQQSTGRTVAVKVLFGGPFLNA